MGALSCLLALGQLLDDPDVRAQFRERFAPLCAPLFKRLHARPTDAASVHKHFTDTLRPLEPDQRAQVVKSLNARPMPWQSLDQKQPWLDFAAALGVAVPAPDTPSTCSWPGCTRDLERVKMKMCAKCRSVVRPRF